MYGVGCVTPSPVETGCLSAGQVGFTLLNMKTVKEAHIGDTIYNTNAREKIKPFPGY